MTKKKIIELEERIIRLADEYDHAPLEKCDGYERAINDLLEERRDVYLDSHKMDAAGIQKMIEFNDYLRNALTGLYSETMSAYNKIKEEFSDRHFFIEPKLWINEEYPATRTDQSDRAKRIWKILLNPDLNRMYNNGCDNGNFDPSESLNHYLYLSEEIDDWNFDIVGLFDVKLPKTNFVYATHNLGSHTLFTIFELMHVRKFRKEININITEPKLGINI